MHAANRSRAVRAQGQSGSLRGRLAALEQVLGSQQEEMAAQRVQLAAQREEIEQLRAERVEAEAAPASPLILPADLRQPGGRRGLKEAAEHGAPERPAGRHTSRRGLLRLGGAAAAAGVATVAATATGRPPVARASGLAWQTGTLNADNQTYVEQQSGFSDPTLLTVLLGTVSNINTPLTSPNSAALAAYDSTPTFAGTVGVYATSQNGTAVMARSAHGGGVSASAGPNFSGVTGFATGSQGIGVLGGGDDGYGVVGSIGFGIDLAANGTGRFLQNARPFAGAPTTGTGRFCEQIRDSNGDMWICVQGGSPGHWVKVAAPQYGYAGGALNLLAVPIRLLDTRAGAPVGNTLPGMPVAYQGTLQMPAGGVTYQGQTIPAKATAVFGNLVVALSPHVNPGSGSSLIAYANGTARPAAVNIVYNPGDLSGEYTSTFTLVAIGAGGLVNLYSQPINAGVAVDLIFDAFGFVM